MWLSLISNEGALWVQIHNFLLCPQHLERGLILISNNPEIGTSSSSAAYRYGNTDQSKGPSAARCWGWALNPGRLGLHSEFDCTGWRLPEVAGTTGQGQGQGRLALVGSRKPESSAGAPGAPSLLCALVPICLLWKIGGEAPEEMKSGCRDGVWVGGNGEGTREDRVARATSLKR